MLAQRGERAQNGSKAVRGKSAQKQGNKKAADKGGVVVTGDEFGTYENINELRGKALKYYKKHLQGTIVENALLGEINIDDVGIVEFTGSGKRALKNSSAKEEKLLLVRYLSELIRDATEISGKKSSKENHRGEYFYYLHTSAEINGQITPVEITLIKRNNGTIQYYNHTLPTLEKSKKDEGASVSTEPESLNEPSASPSIHAPSSASTISPEEAESKENPFHEDEQTALKGMSADAKDVYRLVRAKLAGSSNKKVARAASVGAVLLARHADIIARKIRTALGKPFTAMDYYRNMFALQNGTGTDGFAQTTAARRLKEDMLAWKQKVDDFLAGKLPLHNNVVMRSPLVFDLMGADSSLDIAIDRNILQKLINKHHFTRQNLLELSKKIADPLFVLRAIDTKTGVEDTQKRIVVIDMEINGATVMIPFVVNTAQGMNKIASAYGREKSSGKPNDQWYIDRLNQKNLLYINKNRTARWVAPRTGAAGRHNAPLTKQSFSTLSIADENDLSKMKKENPGFYQSAWHGTPHDFAEFLLSAIGTGEGAQVHGWGLYFAGERSTSEAYKERLSTKRTTIHLGDNSYILSGLGDAFLDSRSGGKVSSVSPLGFALSNLLAENGNVPAAIRGLEPLTKINNKKRREVVEEAIRLLKNNDVSYESASGGKLYEVEIPENDVLLDEDKPFEYQTPFVQEKLLELFQNLLE